MLTHGDNTEVNSAHVSVRQRRYSEEQTPYELVKQATGWRKLHKQTVQVNLPLCVTKHHATKTRCA
jgi:chloramphenicol O-acetyltransferase